ncbi:hypothetical protein LRS71_19370 [Rhodococcus pyridinivorans]|uniref:hypothetical protein n=1 Tax=Rhodococcus pyridinivorans TaxID=103816 RepID=UPI001E4CB44D|nr:hypothetical protein [Rhodococcus pyridinivorans]MCD5421688.1 hypothetical protein [Rhodococcus pyridinivorans]
MKNPQDPRTPQERAYALDESSNGTDPDATRVLHTDDATEAYGRPVTNPTVAYTRYEQWGAQGSEYQPTQAYPSPQGSPSQQGPPSQQPYPPQPGYPPPHGYQPTQVLPGYDPGNPQTAMNPAPGTRGHGIPGQPPTGPAPGTDAGKPRGPRWGLITLAAVVLIALGGTIGFLLSRPDDSTSRVASDRAPATVAPPPTATLPPAPEPTTPGLPLDRIPGGLGEVMGDAGAVVGTITANDGGSITLGVIGGSTVTVVLTPDTEIITLTGDTADSLEVGATAVATGSAVEQGRMTAETVVSASLPSFGGSGR